MIKTIKNMVPQSVKNVYHLVVAILAVIRFRYPAKNLTVIGVTGTDGKTTTATYLYHILKFSGKKVALISTVAAYIGEEEIQTGLHVTSPDPWVLQNIIRNISDKGIEYLVLEATSHGLDQHRLTGTNISIGVLTNITHEHIDYHKTYEKYLKAKAKLFKSVKVAILNKKDKSYPLIKKLVSKQAKIISYPSKQLNKEVSKTIKTNISLSFNQLNAEAAVWVAKEVGVANKEIAKSIKTLPEISGRMAKMENKEGINIFIDFAHTPNALKSVLTAIKKQKGSGKLISVFGCASERDDKKRSMMGEISTRFADISVFTAEDPRYEDIDQILSQMEAGVVKSKGKKYYKIVERGKAITFAINKLARVGDTVVICGKGHEKSMSYNGVEYPWSDEQAVKLALRGKIKKINRK